jgi:hypothetical protein
LASEKVGNWDKINQIKLIKTERLFLYLFEYLWVLAARARPGAARTCFFGLINTPNGRCAPRPIAASLLPKK